MMYTTHIISLVPSFFVTLILRHPKMCVLNPSNFGRDDIIFRAHTFSYNKSLRVVVQVSLKAYILVVIGFSSTKHATFKQCNTLFRIVSHFTLVIRDWVLSGLGPFKN